MSLDKRKLDNDVKNFFHKSFVPCKNKSFHTLPHKAWTLKQFDEVKRRRLFQAYVWAVLPFLSNSQLRFTDAVENFLGIKKAKDFVMCVKEMSNRFRDQGIKVYFLLSHLEQFPT